MAQSATNWTTEPDGEINIKVVIQLFLFLYFYFCNSFFQVGKEGMSALPPRTIPDLLKESCSKFGSNKMLNVKREGKWESITIVELYEQCMRVAKSLVAVGLKRFEGVSIMGFNSPEWMMADLGTIMAGGLATGIYTTNNVETTKYILENSRSRVAIGEHSQILERLLEAGKGMKGLKFVQYSPAPVEQSQKERGVISWDEFLLLGKVVYNPIHNSVLFSIEYSHC